MPYLGLQDRCGPSPAPATLNFLQLLLHTVFSVLSSFWTFTMLFPLNNLNYLTFQSVILPSSSAPDLKMFP